MMLDPIIYIKRELDYIKSCETDKVLDDHQRSKYKIQLLDILWHLEDLIDACDVYEGEDEWYELREQDKFLNKMSGKNTYRRY